jgi:putative transposase
MRKKHGSLSPQEIKRLQGGEMILNELDDDEIALALAVSNSSVRNWRRTLKKNNFDLNSLVRKEGSGTTSKLTNEQKQHVKEIILAGAKAFGFPDERWTGNRVAAMIRQTFNLEYSRSTATELMHALGLSPQMPIVKSHKHSEEEVLRWSQKEWRRIKKSEKTRSHPSNTG